MIIIIIIINMLMPVQQIVLHSRCALGWYSMTRAWGYIIIKSFLWSPSNR
jgi:hypothetical protein